MRRLSLGSGLDRSLDGAVTIDVNPRTHPDIVHDLNVVPWPLPADEFDEVLCRDVIEHLDDVVRTMEEIHRVAKDGAKVVIITPHYSCANSYTDPTHKHHLGLFSFDYFTGGNPWGFYSERRFRKIRTQLAFFGHYKNLHVSWFANRFPRFYEERLAWIFPAWYMVVELQVVKR
jgi:SAM-dependent methyltransferase